MKVIRRKLMMPYNKYIKIYKTITLSSPVAIQYTHFLNAYAKAIYPPRYHIAILSAVTRLIVPLNVQLTPLMLSLTPSSYENNV